MRCLCMERLSKSFHYGHKTGVSETKLYEGWNQLDLFSSERNKEVELNVKYILWKEKKKLKKSCV